jgi:hypothetical protein
MIGMNQGLLLLVPAILVAMWTDTLLRRRRAPAWARLLVWLAPLGAGACALLNVLAIREVFASAANADPSVKTQMLSRGVADAMYWLIAGIAVVLVAAAICAYLQFSRRFPEPT